jgi:integrase
VDWLEQWLSQAVLRESSRRSYRGHLRNHLRPRLSGVLLAEVDVAVLQRLFTGMLDDGVPEATTRRVYSTIRSALNFAAREQPIPGNPTRYLRVPAGRRPHAVVWTARRVKPRRFLASIAGHPLYTAFLVMALCGLRRGEAAGLRWSDLDLDAGLAYVTRQVQRVKGVLTPCPLKTPASLREVALAPRSWLRCAPCARPRRSTPGRTGSRRAGTCSPGPGAARCARTT